MVETELTDVDALASEVQDAVTAAEALATAMDGLKVWASALPDRWAGSGWSTASLDAALGDVSAAVTGLTTPDQVLEQLRAIAAELAKARAVGEAAEQARATGDLDRFATEPAASSPATATAGDLAARIRAAYRDLSAESGSPWVGLVALRSHLTDVPRDQLDRALQLLSREPGVHVQAEANQQTLTDADREAAVTFGDSARHMLKVESPGRSHRARH
jgi:hypothetical protein